MGSGFVVLGEVGKGVLDGAAGEVGGEIHGGGLHLGHDVLHEAFGERERIAAVDLGEEFDHFAVFELGGDFASEHEVLEQGQYAVLLQVASDGVVDLCLSVGSPFGASSCLFSFHNPIMVFVS